ncbi:MAG: iron-sulfur cluster assembly protein [Gammaproteobacteria bacterium]|nr:iron-sulfur cluster assembly protein [Gammaproteobacteria bacterium]
MKKQQDDIAGLYKNKWKIDLSSSTLCKGWVRGRIMMPSKDEINAALDRIIDPELGRGLVQLGLVHSVEIDDNIVYVDLQLTSSACPF